MADLTSILNEVKRLREAVETLPGRINVSAAQVTVVTGLSDISEKLGLIQAGEFRSGNRVSPGDGFSGVRIGYPGFTYGSNLYNIAGVDADTLQFGLRSSDGVGIFGGGNVTLSDGGLRINPGPGFEGIIFGSTAASSDILTFVYDDSGFSITNYWPGKSTRFIVTPESGVGAHILSYDDDPGNPGIGQLDIFAPSKITIGGNVTIWGDSNASTGSVYGNFRQVQSLPPIPSSTTSAYWYFAGDQIVFAAYDGAQAIYKSLLLTGAGVTWIASSDPPTT